jgi:GTP pyrophosphokinase
MAVVERHQDLIDELLAELESYPRAIDRDLIVHAFEFADKAHEGQVRRSGQEFIHHPWGVAKILAGLRMDRRDQRGAAPRHRRDTGVGIEDIQAEFGEKVAVLVEVPS